MSEIIQADFPECAELVFDGRRLPLKLVSVGFVSDNPDSMKVSSTTYEGYPFLATPQILHLVIDGLDTQICVSHESSVASILPSDTHFHLKVLDQKHRDILANHTSSVARRQK